MIQETITKMNLSYADKKEKTVRVYVPAHEEGETLPVIYMTDGQNLFEEELSSFGSWYTREAVRSERGSTGKAAIIVGIFNTDGPLERTNELLPGSIGALNFPPQMPAEIRKTFVPGGEEFDDFVVNTVMPAAEERFPVKKGRAYTAFCGSSSGGLQAFFTALRHPDLFGAAGVFSPAFMFYFPQDLTAWIRSKIRQVMPYLYLYSGAGNEQEQLTCQLTEFVCGVLEECYPPGMCNEVILPEESHNEKAWAKVFPDFLHTFLFKGGES